MRGVPSFAVFFLDAVKTDLNIDLVADEAGSTTLHVTDTTIFGQTHTSVLIGGPEVERSSKTGRKKFMVSGFEVPPGKNGARSGAPALTIQCRLFERGDGWYTQQRWSVFSDNRGQDGTFEGLCGCLLEEMRLLRPNSEPITVVRVYRRKSGTLQSIGDSQKGASRTSSTTSSSQHVVISALALAGCIGLRMCCVPT